MPGSPLPGLQAIGKAGRGPGPLFAMETELRCPVCHDYFAEPVMLQCTHHICNAHIVASNVGSREHLPCPVCSDVTVVPEGGLRVDRTLQVVVDLWQKDQQAAQPQSGDDGEAKAAPMCGFCEEKPATRHCQQCAGVLCEECEKTSHSKGFFKSHNIVDISEVGATSSKTPDIASRMLCDDHPDEKLSFYCLDCRKPVCSHCLILGEHKGHQQTPIDQAFETGKETLGAWVEKLQQRINGTEELLEQLRMTEIEVNRGAEAQRTVINNEMDHLRELIETKRHQLLSKSALEEKQKRVHIQAQVDRAEAARQESSGLVTRSKELLVQPSEHAFLAVVLPLIQDMKKCAGQPVDDSARVSPAFRPLSTDAQVRSLGDLDLGHPRPPPQQHMSAGVTSMVGNAQSHGAGAQVMPQSYNVANATLSYLPVQPGQHSQQQQQQQPAPVYYVRSVHAQ